MTPAFMFTAQLASDLLQIDRKINNENFEDVHEAIPIIEKDNVDIEQHICENEEHDERNILFASCIFR